MSILKEKKELRNEMLIKRANLGNDLKQDYDLWVCEELERVIQKNNSKVVHVYLPMGKEINITPLIMRLLETGVKVVAPKTLPNRKLQNLVLHSLEEIDNGFYGTTHPANSTEYAGNYDLIIVPGLAFDDNNYRLGYGGGYYDNFLSKHTNALKVGIFYPIQKADIIPTEPHDVPLDCILINPDIFK